MKRATLIALAAAVTVVLTGAARASDGISLRGYGTPVLDGVLGPGEWDTAGHYDFQANRAPAEGGGTVPATLYVMNDSTNLYLALGVGVTNLGYSAFDGIFPAPDPNPFGIGNDILRATPFAFEDTHWHPVGPNNWDWLMDVADGGSNDGAAVVRQNGGVGVFEVAHPLNSADDLHDFSLTIPRHVRFIGSFQHCVTGTCAVTFMPPTSLNQVVIVSGTHVPPETTITAGPAEGAQLPDYGNFEFVGADDVAPPSELEYECKVDAEDWSSCDSPFGPATTLDGWHTLSIRALDDMLNADPTPAQRYWRIDTRSPSKPKVVVARRRAMTELRFSATDSGTPSKRLRFRCAVDAKRLYACASRFRLRLRPGRHILRIRAADPAGNESDVKSVRFAVRRAT